MEESCSGNWDVVQGVSVSGDRDRLESSFGEPLHIPGLLSQAGTCYEGLPAIHSFPNWKGGHRLLLHFGKLPFQHGPDEATGSVSLLFQVIELGFEIERVTESRFVRDLAYPSSLKN